MTTFRALRHRNFKLFFAGQLTSLIGTWMQNVAQSWLVYRLTGQATQLGLITFCSQIPVFLLATVGGAAADRGNKRLILIVTQTVSMLLAFLLAYLTLSGQVRIWHLYLIATTLGIVNAFDIPGRQSFVVDMVGKPDLANAIALNSSMFNGARLIGPALAGVLVVTVGEGRCFFLNGLSFLAVIVSLLLMRLNRSERPIRSGGLALSEGFRYVQRTLLIRYILTLLGLVSLTGMPYAVLMPLFADRILHGGPKGLGILMSCIGLGALVGALILASREGVDGLGDWVARAAAGFGVGLLLFAHSEVFALSAVLLVPIGCCMMVQMASSNTLIQTLVPDELRGRVMAIYSMTFMGMAPFGSLFAGALADRVGAPETVTLGGTVCIAGALLFYARLPRVRSLLV